MAPFPSEPNPGEDRPHQGLSSRSSKTPNSEVAEQFRQASLYVDRQSMGRFFSLALIFGLILGGVVATGIVIAMRHFGLNEVTPLRQAPPATTPDSIQSGSDLSPW